MTSTAVSLPEVRERLEEKNRGTWDAVIEPAEVTLVQGRIVSPRLYRYEYPTGLYPSPWATGQLCQLVNIPAAYFRRCPPELQDTQFNYWAKHLEDGGHTRVAQQRQARGQNRRIDNSNGRAERWLVRARGDVLRGVLTERYVRLDHLELFAALSPALSQEYEVDWFALTDESFHLRLHDARLFQDALPGDRLMAGVHIANSEVGKRAVTVDALIYRLVCTNGMIRKVAGHSLLHQRHIAVSKMQFSASVQQAVKDALEQSAQYLSLLSAAVAFPLGDVEKTLKKLVLDWGLTKATEEAVKAAILAEHPSQHETLYGFINGLTAAARHLAPDERYTLETQAGALLERCLEKGSSPTLVYPGRKGSSSSHDTPRAAVGVPAAEAQSRTRDSAEASEKNLALFALP